MGYELDITFSEYLRSHTTPSPIFGIIDIWRRGDDGYTLLFDTEESLIKWQMTYK